MAGIKLDMKLVFNAVSVLGALAWGWYKMELRVTALEMKIEHNEKMAKLRTEIQGLKSNGHLKDSGNQF